MDTRRTMSLTPIDAAIRFERMSFQQDCAAITADDADAALMRALADDVGFFPAKVLANIGLAS